MRFMHYLTFANQQPTFLIRYVDPFQQMNSIYNEFGNLVDLPEIQPEVTRKIHPSNIHIIKLKSNFE